jgi:ABC-type nitrate/sulfonate/bicarbonate transport system substrate-binding protein
LFGSFNARKDWANTHNTEFAAIVAALDEAIDFINQHPNEAKQYMRKYVPAQFADQVALYPDALYVSSAGTTNEMFQKEADSEFNLGIITAKLDIDSLLYHAK